MTLRSLAQRRRTLLLGLVLGLLSVAMLAYLVYRERDAFSTFDWQLDWRALVVAFALMLVGLIMAGLVWASMMRTFGSPLPFSRHIRYYLVSHLARRLPGTVWYVAGRGYLYKQHGESLRLVTMASSLELVLMIVAGAVVTLALWSYMLRTLPLVYLIALGITILVGLVAVQPSSVRWMLRKLGLDATPVAGYRHMILWLSLYVGIWIIGGLMFYAIVYSVTRAPLIHLPFVIGSWTLVGTLSVLVFFLPNNLGFTEIGLSLLLSTFLPSSVAVVVAVLSRILVLGFELAAAGITMLILQIMQQFSARYQR